MSLSLSSVFPLVLNASRVRACAHQVPNAPDSYFNRDVECVRTFFSRRFKYESSVYPKFSSTIRDGVREFDLDVEVAASGFKREDRKALDDVRCLNLTQKALAVADLRT